MERWWLFELKLSASKRFKITLRSLNASRCSEHVGQQAHGFQIARVWENRLMLIRKTRKSTRNWLKPPTAETGTWGYQARWSHCFVLAMVCQSGAPPMSPQNGRLRKHAQCWSHIQIPNQAEQLRRNPRVAQSSRATSTIDYQIYLLFFYMWHEKRLGVPSKNSQLSSWWSGVFPGKIEKLTGK